MCITYLQQYEPKGTNIGYAGHTKFVCGIVEKMIENNRVSVIGEIVSEFSFSTRYLAKGFTWWICR